MAARSGVRPHLIIATSAASRFFAVSGASFGHQVGDILLKEVAGAIKTWVRAEDLACRYGRRIFSHSC